jgi:hypothetical protein
MPLAAMFRLDLDVIVEDARFALVYSSYWRRSALAFKAYGA